MGDARSIFSPDPLRGRACWWAGVIGLKSALDIRPAPADLERYRHGAEHAVASALRLHAVLWTIVALNVALWLSAPLGVCVAAAVVSIPLIGWCQHSLFNGNHEAIHNNFGRPQNETLAASLTAYPVGFGLTGYRRIHFAHHKHFGDPQLDPDFAGYTPYPRSKVQFFGRIAWNATGLPALLQFLRRGGAVQAAEPARGFPVETASIVVAQLIILTPLVVSLGPVRGVIFYIGFWMAPLACVAKVLAGLRVFCEHASPDPSVRVVRTITGRPWETATLGMFAFNYHGDHHTYSWVPCASLPALHGMLSAEPASVGKGWRYEVFQGGYLAFLAQTVRELPWRAAR